MGVGGLLMEIASRPQPRAPVTRSDGWSRRCHSCRGRSSRFRPPAARRRRSSWRTWTASRSCGASRKQRSAPWRARSSSSPAMRGTRSRRRSPSSTSTSSPNPEFATGLASSLRVGLAAMPSDVTGALVLLGDMPWIEPRLIDALIEAFVTRKVALAAVPSREGRRGNPVLLGRGLFEARCGSKATRGRAGCRRPQRRRTDRSRGFRRGGEFDIDMPDDLAAARRFRGHDL